MKSHELVKAADSKMSGHVLGAANIKRELTAMWPDIKFKVRSESFAGGDSIHVGWKDGPTTRAVKEITGKYEEGSFDGIVDLYTYNNSAFPSIYDGAKYVQEEKDCHEAYETIKKVMLERMARPQEWETIRSVESWAQTLMDKTAIPIGSRIMGLSRDVDHNDVVNFEPVAI